MPLIVCPDVRFWEVLESEESLRRLSWHAALSLSSPSALETGGKVWGEAREGSTHEAGSYLAWNPEIRKLDRQMAAVGGASRLGMDDLFLIGSPDILFPAMEEF